MFGLVERAKHIVMLAPDIAQMQEVHTVAQTTHQARQIIVGPGAQRPGAKGYTIGRFIDRMNETPVVGFRRHDPRQA